MKARDIMTPAPQVCRSDTPLPEVARMMCDGDCGAIPVVDADDKPVGMVTDRDIACRIVAADKDALQAEARDCMTHEPVTVSLDASADECYRTLEQKQIRRLIVVDQEGVCCGVIAQADVARTASERETAEVVREVSKERRPARDRRPTIAP